MKTEEYYLLIFVTHYYVLPAYGTAYCVPLAVFCTRFCDGRLSCFTLQRNKVVQGHVLSQTDRLTTCLTACRFTFRSVWLPVCLDYLSVRLSVYLSVCLTDYLSVRQSVYLSVWLTTCLSWLSIRLSVCLSVWLPVCVDCLFVCPVINPSVHSSVVRLLFFWKSFGLQCFSPTRSETTSSTC